MDPTSFDDLTKALASSTSRRQVLKTIVATTLGSLLGLDGIGTALRCVHELSAPFPFTSCVLSTSYETFL